MIHPVDARVGENLRAIRKRRGMSQSDVARALGVSFQQLQKYESGTNRLSASAMYDATQALGVPVGAFFEGLAGVPVEALPAPPDKLATAAAALRPRERAMLLQLARSLADRKG